MDATGRGTIRIGTLFGIPILVHFSWLLALLLIASSLVAQLTPSVGALAPALGLLTALVFFASIVAHELAHSVVAIRLGTSVKSITLFVFGGVASIGSEPKRARDELFIAAAGPLASFAIGVLAILGARAPLPAYVVEPLAWLGRVNIGVAIFNCLPGFPLDGGRIARALLWLRWRDQLRATRVAAGIGRAIAWGFIGLGALASLTVGLVNGLYMLFLGWFLRNAADGADADARLRAALAGFVVANVTTRHPPYPVLAGLPIDELPALPPDMPLVEALSALGSAPCAVVRDAGGVYGFVERDRLWATVRAIVENPRRREPALRSPSAGWAR